MYLNPEVKDFFAAIRNDNRIGPVHISLFMAIVQHWNNNNCQSPLHVFGKDLMQLAKISGVATYHRCIKELQEYGYIHYQPSFNHLSGSIISLQTHK